jgi:two-component system chemotaxis sensor kinase CheA
MSLRLLPDSNIFIKMERDRAGYSKRFQKNVSLILIGEETDVDKNSSTICPIRSCTFRNSTITDRIPRRANPGKQAEQGRITLGPKNTGRRHDYCIGRRKVDKPRLNKAEKKGLANSENCICDQGRAFLIFFLPGFPRMEPKRFNCRTRGRAGSGAKNMKCWRLHFRGKRAGQGTTTSIRHSDHPCHPRRNER